jgi:predicted RNase H-like HicB family nuclease
MTVAVETFTTQVTLPEAEPSAAPAPGVRVFTLMAIHQDGRWVSLCRELDVSSFGATADQALDNLEEAVREVLALQREGGPGAGTPVPDAALESFFSGHDGHGSVTSRVLPLA